MILLVCGGMKHGFLANECVSTRLKLGRFDQHSGEHLTAEESPTEYLQVSLSRIFSINLNQCLLDW